ncbi:hypothetical protein V8E36_007976 [Tilletia maclaganii]
MASTSSAAGGSEAAAGGSLLLSPAERTAFGYLFNIACPPDSGGILTADSAVAFFGKSGLPATTLGAIWALADDKNNGFLDAKGFSLACRLIGHAQAGSPVDFRAASTSGPVPTLEGISIPGLPANASTAPAQGSAAADTASVTIKPADRSRYTRIFANAGPSNGLLDSDKAKDLFVKSNLSVDKLAAIWGLADTHQRGALDLTDFIIAMHFIQNIMNGSLQALPATLPPGLYESASVGAPKPSQIGGAQPGSPLKAIRQQSTGGSFSTPTPGAPLRHQTTGSGFAGAPGPAAIPRQLTGQFQSPAQGSRVGSPTPAASGFRSPAPAPASASPFGVTPSLPTAASMIAAGSSVSPPWAVPAATIQRAAAFFAQLDTTNSGLLPGASVVPFFMQSQLPEATLAQIWDMADVHQRGSLGLEEFSLAMHLIGESMAGKALPALGPGQGLPRELLPPSARGANLPEPVAQNQSDTQKDLFSLMDDDDDATSGALKAAAALPPALKKTTASTFVNPVASPPPSAIRQPAGQAQGNFNAFDDDFFSAPMPGSATAPAVGPASAIKSVRIADRPPSIIASPDTVVSTLPPSSPAPGQAAPTSLAAVQTQALQKDIDTETARKAAFAAEATALENSIETDSASLAELEARLKTARSASDAEQARVAGLRERAATQSGELASLRAELITVESNLSALKVERDEGEQALMKEREDVREVRKQMEQVRIETEALKGEVERVKKELRKEKGLGAITRKQLSSASADKAKIESELETARSGQLEGEDEAPAASAVHTDTAAPADRAAALSPTGSVRSNNPFDRLNISSPPAASSPAPEAPFHADSGAGGSPSGGAAGTAAGLVAGAGAAVAGIAAAARAAVGLDNQEPAAADQQRTESDKLDTDTDAAGAGAGTAEAPKQDIAPSPAHRQQSSAFDDAFGDGEPTAPATSANDAFSSAFDDDFGADAAVASGGGPTVSAHAPTSSSTAFDDAFSGFDDPAPGSTAPSTAAIVGPGAGAVTSESTPDVEGDQTIRAESSEVRPSQNEEEDDSSDDDDDEGPEDLDVPGSNRATHLQASPFGAGEEDRPVPDEPSVPAVTTTSDNTGAAASASVATSAFASPSSQHLTLETPVHGALSTQVTGSDTFHDAVTASPLSRAQSPADIESVEAAEPAASAVPKPARRAPPPAPTKAGSTSASTSTPTTSTIVPPSSTAAEPGSGSAFDDFEAAFEDLGPSVPVSSSVASGLGGGAANTTASTTADFDDAFDNDFDFVPSFSAVGSSSAAPASSANAAFDDAFGEGPISSSSVAASAAAPSTSAAPLTDFNAAFADFDDSFGSPKQGSGAAPAASSLGGATSQIATGSGSGSGTGTNVSAPSSGFSFEDAFEPAGDSVLSPPAQLSSSANQPTTTTSVVINPPPALPPRDASASTGVGADSSSEPAPTPALPDDAPPVQQLCAMGFSRAKVIAALEKSNYRVEKALQRLLAG